MKGSKAKKCTTCKKQKPLEAFYQFADCKVCAKEKRLQKSRAVRGHTA